MAGPATPTSADDHPPADAKTNPKLTFHPDHLGGGADHHSLEFLLLQGPQARGGCAQGYLPRAALDTWSTQDRLVGLTQRAGSQLLIVIADNMLPRLSGHHLKLEQTLYS
jgi:hypothetical protein